MIMFAYRELQLFYTQTFGNTQWLDGGDKGGEQSRKLVLDGSQAESKKTKINKQVHKRLDLGRRDVLGKVCCDSNSRKTSGNDHE
jgi:hypothetical protein